MKMYNKRPIHDVISALFLQIRPGLVGICSLSCANSYSGKMRSRVVWIFVSFCLCFTAVSADKKSSSSSSYYTNRYAILMVFTVNPLLATPVHLVRNVALPTMLLTSVQANTISTATAIKQVEILHSTFLLLCYKRYNMYHSLNFSTNWSINLSPIVG